MIELPPMPPSIEQLPRDDRGYPIPWFVAMVDGVPDFRIADGRKIVLAIEEKLCWVCGRRLNPSKHTFVCGPMSSINRNHGEPPCHHACAEFSSMACPHLAKPMAQRRESGMPEGTVVPGIAAKRKQLVTMLWQCRGYEVVEANHGFLFRLPNPSLVQWFREGRKATREEIIEGLNGSLASLKEMCGKMTKAEIQELDFLCEKALSFVPN